MKYFFKIFLLIIPCVALGQVKIYDPATIRKIEIDFSKEFIEKFNTAESTKQCEIIYKKMNDNRISFEDLQAEDLEALRYCDDGRENPWQKPFLGCSWYCGGCITSIKVANSLDTLNTKKIHDSDYGSAWIGNSSNTHKEKITYNFEPESAYVTDIVIVNGNVRTDSLFNTYSRIKKIKLFYNNKEVAILNLLDTKDEQVFQLPPMGHTNRKNFESLKKKKKWNIAFQIEEIYPGTKNDIAISELYFDGDGGAHPEEEDNNRH